MVRKGMGSSQGTKMEPETKHGGNEIENRPGYQHRQDTEGYCLPSRELPTLGNQAEIDALGSMVRELE